MKPEKCRGCPLEEAPGPVWGKGPKDARLMLLGEAPGTEEVANGEPFIGPAGRVLGVACHVAGVDRRETYITNAVKCLPPKRGKSHAPTKAEIEFCKKAWLDDELEELRNLTTSVAVGAVALQALTGKRLEITEWRGSVLTEGDVT